MNALIRVLVVDDSAFARKVMREVLSNRKEIEVVGIARDGLDALEKIAELSPDVITLDLVMPNLDGLGVLRALPMTPKRPAVVVVSIAGEDTELGVSALEAGAFDVVTKPTALAVDQLYELSDELSATVIAAAASRTTTSSERPVSAPVRAPAKARTSVLVIGTSTGGPQALSYLLKSLPKEFPVPIAIVLHMPLGYTDTFARRLDAECSLDVMEAREGLPLRPGLAIVAQAGMDLAIMRTFGATEDWHCRLKNERTESLHRPSVDALFTSAAKYAGDGTLGVVLTGMGNDGTAGARAIRAAGGRVLTESEVSCVVYGMPRAVVEAGQSDANAPLEAMASLIVRNL